MKLNKTTNSIVMATNLEHFYDTSKIFLYSAYLIINTVKNKLSLNIFAQNLQNSYSAPC